MRIVIDGFHWEENVPQWTERWIILDSTIETSPPSKVKIAGGNGSGPGGSRLSLLPPKELSLSVIKKLLRIL